MAPLLVLLSLAPVGARAGSVDAACSAAAREANASVRIFVETSGAVLPKPRQGDWRELGNEAERKALADGAEPPNTEAVVRTARAATLVSMYFQDKSAEWAHVVDYCFRPTGTLARVKGTFNSYTAGGAEHPGIRRRRTTTFDDAGAIVRTESHTFDLESDKPLPALAFADVEDPIYPALRALPFWADLAPPSVAAKLEPDGVVATVREHLPAIKACYEHALQRTPKVAGKVVARFTIDDGGKVAAFAWQSDQMHSAAFNTCAQHVVETLRFAPAKGPPVTVTFPFVFESADAKVTVSPTPPTSALPPSSPSDGKTAER